MGVWVDGGGNDGRGYEGEKWEVEGLFNVWKNESDGGYENRGRRRAKEGKERKIYIGVGRKSKGGFEKTKKREGDKREIQE